MCDAGKDNQTFFKMSISLADQYFLKAEGYYPFWSEFVVENLNYAFSYDEYHAPSLVLMGRLKMELLKDFKGAKHCFELALTFEPSYVETNEYYSLLCLWTSDFATADSIIDRSVRVKGIDLALMRYRKAKMYELMGHLKLAKSEVDKLIKTSVTNKHLRYYQDERSRLKKLIKMRKSKSRDVLE